MQTTPLSETENPFVDDAFAKHVGIELLETGDATAVARLTIKPYHLNGAGLVHGGAVFTLAAWTMAVAANTKLGLSLGLNASITWLRPATSGTLTASARRIAASGKVSTWSVEVTDEEGHTVAVFQGLGWHKVQSSNRIQADEQNRGG